MKTPSIFNDVIGPVMRGPSSSHSAAAVRIGWIARSLMDAAIQHVLVEFDESGSLPTTYESQGSEMGLLGGLLGFDISDKRLIRYKEEIVNANIQVRCATGQYGDPHPNTYRLTLTNASERHTLIAISTGGGMVEIVEIDGNDVAMIGDMHELLVFFEGDEREIVAFSEKFGADVKVNVKKGQRSRFVEIKSYTAFDKEQIDGLLSMKASTAVKAIPPVLPILTPPKMEIPFANCRQMLGCSSENKRNLSQLAIEYECQRGGIGPDDVLGKMIDIVRIVRMSVREGLEGTRYDDRILGYQSGNFMDCLKSGKLLDIGMLNRIISYVTALMEVKSSMGIIVAAPTAGSCGGLPGAILGAAETMDCSEKETAEAFLAAGMIGVFIAKFATFAAEVGGCQAECGAGSGMAAAALVNLMGGTTEQAVAAASLALQSSFGMVCDPVANRVEVPCLGKNVLAASNAIACANMALAGFDPVVSLDEVIPTMDRIGKSIPCQLRCTGLGGLSITKTSNRIKRELEEKKKK